jgi:hypothetical protein
MTTNNLDFKLLLDALTEAIAEKVSDKIKPAQPTPTPTTPDEEWLTTEQACKLLNIKSSDTLKKRVLEGRIEPPVSRGGRPLFYRKSSLIKHLQNG